MAVIFTTTVDEATWVPATYIANLASVTGAAPEDISVEVVVGGRRLASFGRRLANIDIQTTILTPTPLRASQVSSVITGIVADPTSVTLGVTIVAVTAPTISAVTIFSPPPSPPPPAMTIGNNVAAQETGSGGDGGGGVMAVAIVLVVLALGLVGLAVFVYIRIKNKSTSTIVKAVAVNDVSVTATSATTDEKGGVELADESKI